ncbi:hypothetical protein EVAR_89090_1 [Eumeta japonica]|uniref:Uncharacterized protein n=1 Tax=Eumeta variegata TaxID=151549 RepID=A0A4C1XF45_EUMVA|nr:hypothetical protein EVAR_89090_1 [Eumeta japonica]
MCPEPLKDRCSNGGLREQCGLKGDVVTRKDMLGEEVLTTVKNLTNVIDSLLSFRFALYCASFGGSVASPPHRGH